MSKTKQRTLRGEVEKWQVKKDEIKELEAKAASEGFEFKKWEEKFVDAKYNLEEFIDYIKKCHLKKGKEEPIKNLRTKLEEMWNLLQKRNYEQFENKFDEFNGILESLYPLTEPEPERNEVYEKDKDIEKLVAGLGLREEEPAKEKNRAGELITSAVKPIVSGEIQKNEEIYEILPLKTKVEINKDYANEITERTRQSSSEPSAETAEVLNEVRSMSKNYKNEARQEIPESPTESATPHPLPAIKEVQKGPSQGLWARFKERGKKLTEAVFNRETGNAGIEKRLAHFKTQVESARILPEEKKALLDRLRAITIKHQEDIGAAVKERDEAAGRMLEAYAQGKVSSIKIAKAAMKKFTKEKLSGVAKKSKLKFVVKNFIKTLGIVALGFGVYGLAVSKRDSIEEGIDKLIVSIKEQDARRAYDLYPNPAEISQQNPENLSMAVEAGHHTVGVEVLNNKEGILNGVNKIIHDNPNIFIHDNGQPWTADEIHKWKVEELKDMGFKIKSDNWSYPMTAHGGAKVEVFTDTQGQPHFKLASDEHVTWNKNADADIKEKAVVHHAAKAVAGKETAGQFLTERGSNPKEFIAVYDKMVDAAVDRLNDSFILRGAADKFLQDKINVISGANPIDSGSLAMVEKILDAEDRFKFNQPDWLKTFSQTMFDKSDKAMRLALAPDRDVLLEPIKTNGGHAARIWDPTEGKDIFIYDKNRVFNTNDDGRLIVEDEHGAIKLFNQKQALKMSEKP